MQTSLEIKKPNGSEPTALQVSSPTPMDLLQTAVANDLDIAKIQQLMDLQLKWEANEARKAFVRAMNDFKAHPPVITKNRAVSFGNTNYSHATLDNVCDTVTKSLSSHGITHRWKIDDTGELIAVTCILTHDLGHSEETTMRGPADSSGSKNAIQARASTITYLERYTLLAATGLAAGGTDNDGAGPGLDDTSERVEFIKNCRNFDELKAVFAENYKAACAARDQQAVKAIVAAYEAKKKEFHANH